MSRISAKNYRKQLKKQEEQSTTISKPQACYKLRELYSALYSSNNLPADLINIIVDYIETPSYHSGIYSLHSWDHFYYAPNRNKVVGCCYLTGKWCSINLCCWSCCGATAFDSYCTGDSNGRISYYSMHPSATLAEKSYNWRSNYPHLVMPPNHYWIKAYAVLRCLPNELCFCNPLDPWRGRSNTVCRTKGICCTIYPCG
jgi:hypothetical protein